jgi:hypothetical protein
MALLGTLGHLGQAILAGIFMLSHANAMGC